MHTIRVQYIRVCYHWIIMDVVYQQKISSDVELLVGYLNSCIVIASGVYFSDMHRRLTQPSSTVSMQRQHRKPKSCRAIK